MKARLILCAILMALIVVACVPRATKPINGPPLLPPPPITPKPPTALCNFAATCGGPNLVKHLNKQHAAGVVWCDEPPNGFDADGVPRPFKRAGRVIGYNPKGKP